MAKTALSEAAVAALAVAALAEAALTEAAVAEAAEAEAAVADGGRRRRWAIVKGLWRRREDLRPEVSGRGGQEGGGGRGTSEGLALGGTSTMAFA